MLKTVIHYLKEKGLRETVKRGLSKYCYNLLLNHPNLIMYPSELLIEPTSYCNLRCKLCPNSTLKRKHGYMTLEQFKRIIDQVHGFVKHLTIGMSGEPLMHRDVFKMIKYASDKGIMVSLPTNAVLLDTFDFNEIFDSGVKNINFAFDGTTKEVYESYRAGSNFERVLNNITRFSNEKRKQGLKSPNLVLQFLVMKHNEHQVDEMIALAKEKIRPDYLYLKNIGLWTNASNKDRDEMAKQWLPKDEKYSRYAKGKTDIEQKSTICPFAFDQTVILWNGDLVVCCADVEGEFKIGNVFESSFKRLFRSERYLAFRKGIIKRALRICKDCDQTTSERFGRFIKID